MSPSLFSKGQKFYHYLLKEEIVVNNKIINEIIIWTHFEDKHASYIKKEMMLKFALELDGTDYPVEKQGFREDGRAWKKYNYDKFYEGNKAYRLFWYLEEGSKSLWVIHCLRNDKNDKNYNINIMTKRTQPINYNKLDLIDRQRLFEETVKEAEEKAKK